MSVSLSLSVEVVRGTFFAAHNGSRELEKVIERETTTPAVACGSQIPPLPPPSPLLSFFTAAAVFCDRLLCVGRPRNNLRAEEEEVGFVPEVKRTRRRSTRALPASVK